MTDHPDIAGSGRSPDVFIHADGRVELRNHRQYLDPYHFVEAVQRRERAVPLRDAGSLPETASAVEQRFWGIVPAVGLHGVRVFVER